MTQYRPSLQRIVVASVFAAAAGVAAEADLPPVDLPKCPTWESGVPVPIEHSHGACDPSAENSPAKFAANNAAIVAGASTGALLRTKDERSWVCPEDDDGGDISAMMSVHGAVPLGPMTKWVVRNTSSNSVSLALVDATRNGIEVSAVNNKISPAHADPDAVLPPGQWKALDVTLGTILHVRELVRVGDTVGPGRVLLRHRPGLTPILDRSFEPVDSPYESGDMEDIEERPEQIDAKESQRPPFSFDRMCNFLTRIFVNRVGSPVDVYWAGASDLGSSSGAAERGQDCQSRFAFHLGADATPAKGFMDQRDTIMSVENSYLGHRFVARLTSDPSRIVDEIVLDRSEVVDCPRERKVKASATARQDIGVEVGGKVDEGEDDVKNDAEVVTVMTGFEAFASNLTATLVGALGAASA